VIADIWQRMPLRNTYHCEVLEGSGSLDVLQCLLQVLQLRVDLALGLLGTLHGLSLERLDSLALVIVVVVVVVTLVCRLSCELLCRRCLSLRVKVLNLGLTKDAVKWSAFPIDST
jgi:hypothetical protein